ncbi:S-protein homolog 5-like [Neltuma alba]|uniref:S-protein homolog 5-like n=1 Tax=Neltuma alba TaxID=207710 RepID=UPI0010A35EB6|nr:S-protein homolog 5-like [Prosopis alba]
MKSVILILSVLVFLAPHWVDARTHVKITNYLYGNLELRVHCRSKDNDLGNHLLRAEQSFEFSFSPNIWGTTLFYCSFKWDGSYKWFVIYDDGRDEYNCNDATCIWQITQDRPCQVNAPGNGLLCYPWDGE